MTNFTVSPQPLHMYPCVDHVCMGLQNYLAHSKPLDVFSNFTACAKFIKVSFHGSTGNLKGTDSGVFVISMHGHIK